MLLYNLPPYTIHITYHHLELSYQFVLSSRHCPSINLRWFSFNFPSIPSPPSPFCVIPPLVVILQNSHMVQSVLCVHIHFLSSDQERHLWLSKVFIKLMHVCVCILSRDLLIFSVSVPSFFSYFLCYPYFGTFHSSWSLSLSLSLSLYIYIYIYI